MAELADALDSGSSGVTLVGVQVPLFALVEGAFLILRKRRRAGEVCATRNAKNECFRETSIAFCARGRLWWRVFDELGDATYHESRPARTTSLTPRLDVEPIAVGRTERTYVWGRKPVCCTPGARETTMGKAGPKARPFNSRCSACCVDSRLRAGPTRDVIP